LLCDEIIGICQFAFSVQIVFDVFNHRNINFKSDNQINEIMQLIMDIANNTRIWENNGFTANETFKLMERPNLRALPKGDFMGGSSPNLISIPGVKSKKIGRNDPCHCGSGKKYKKCCEKDGLEP